MFDRVVDTRPWIEIDGDFPPLVNDNLREMVMSEQEGGLSHLELRLDNAANHAGAGIDFAFEFTDTESLPLGKEVRVLTSGRNPDPDDDGPREIFKGRVSALELVADEGGAPELAVLAEDSLMGLRMRRRTRFFDEQALKDMIAAAIDGSDMSGTVADYLSTEIAARHQVDETDLAFLRRLLVDWDADAQVVEGKLQIAPRSDIKRGEVTLDLGASLRSVRITADLAAQRTEFRVAGFDIVAGDTVEKKLKTKAFGPGEGRFSAEYLAGFHKSYEHITGAAILGETEAQGWIDAKGARTARRFVVARGVAVGNPKIRVGTHLKLEGIGPRFENTYYVTAARHAFSVTDGYRTEFEAECAYFKGSVVS